MIARTWLGRTDAGDVDNYLEYLKETGARDCLRTPGNRGVMVLRSVNAGEARFLFISFWESMEVIRAFAGDELGRARYYVEDRKYLLDFPSTVDHFEVALHQPPVAG